jgi:hypothetical protein
MMLIVRQMMVAVRSDGSPPRSWISYWDTPDVPFADWFQRTG